MGWVDKKQVHNARVAFYRPDIQTVYIHNDRNAKGKPELNIVAYRNGKQLSKEQASALYENMRKQQQREMRNMQYMSNWMHEMSSGMPLFAIAPLMVLPQETNNKKNK